MSFILEKTIETLLDNDKGNIYQSHLNHLCDRYSSLSNWKTASKTKDIDKIVMQALEVVVKAASDADFLYKEHSKIAAGGGFKGFITKVILKTLKIAQATLAVLLIKSPLKVGIAYNAMHHVIKYLEREMRKQKLLKKK